VRTPGAAGRTGPAANPWARSADDPATPHAGTAWRALPMLGGTSLALAMAGLLAGTLVLG